MGFSRKSALFFMSVFRLADWGKTEKGDRGRETRIAGWATGLVSCWGQRSAMEPDPKKPADRRPPAAKPGRKLRFHAAHLPRPQPPHYISGKDRPGDRRE
ncbi:MAG: hypothetical protein ACYSWU_27870, partial [Planctomycetota bacterium]